MRTTMGNFATSLRHPAGPRVSIRALPEDATRHIFRFLDGASLLKAREVCLLWSKLAVEEGIWRHQCLQIMCSLERDRDIWPLITEAIMIYNEFKWRRLYPIVSALPQWRSALAKPGRVFCRIRAFQLMGDPLSKGKLQPRLTVSRRFPLEHLPLWVLPDAAVLYLEPAGKGGRRGFDELIEYLRSRGRAGLAIQGEYRYIVIPPGEYARVSFGYHGNSLLCVAQEGYPAVIN